jgi:hypothetical protein
MRTRSALRSRVSSSSRGSAPTWASRASQASTNVLVDVTGRGYEGRRMPSTSYSPITAQRNPIMMKNPENRAMRPMPPYGESAPWCGTS